MLTKVAVNNYKSLNAFELEPGRVNVIIGENGCGKSNFLEALTFAAAASQNKLDNEFLTNRGIRVTSPQLMRANFVDSDETSPIEITLHNDGKSVYLTLHNDNQPYSSWTSGLNVDWSELQEPFKEQLTSNILQSIYQKALAVPDDVDWIKQYIEQEVKKLTPAILDKALKDTINSNSQMTLRPRLKVSYQPEQIGYANFMIYAPENSALRQFYQEGQIEPLGVNGQGLLKLIQVIHANEPEAYQDIIESLKLFSWFNGAEVPDEFGQHQDSLMIEDKFTQLKIDQRSANEGFLFVLFYVALMVSRATPTVFAIDNIDTALNPKLCIALMKRLSALAVKYNKQLFVTTHNPALLDGLDLNDDQQRLFVFKRNRKGHTTAQRITAEKRPKSSTTHDYLNLSDAMLRGYLKSLPTNF